MDSLKSRKAGEHIPSDVVIVDDPGRASSVVSGSSPGRVLHAERDIGKLRIMQSDMDTMARYDARRRVALSQ